MVYFPMKRGREEDQVQNLTTMANYLMLLSKASNNPLDMITSNNNNNNTNIQQPISRVFECKTCNRQFPSFQALGGHRASHKKPRLMEGDTTSHDSSSRNNSPPKAKTHECSICGLEFAIGQALGGHMRRHRAAAAAAAINDGHQAHHDQDHDHDHKRNWVPMAALALPVLKRANSGRRVFGLDLNLTPLENDDLEFGIAGKMAPLVELCL